MMTTDHGLLLLIESAGIGDGEPDLGEKLMKAFLSQLLESGTVPAEAIFMNSGIFLTTEGSPVTEQLRALEAAGCRISSCGTCLDYYDRRDKILVGQAGNMKETVRAMLDATKILKL